MEHCSWPNTIFHKSATGGSSDANTPTLVPSAVAKQKVFAEYFPLPAAPPEVHNLTGILCCICQSCCRRPGYPGMSKMALGAYV